jgi:hypothetical protein
LDEEIRTNSNGEALEALKKCQQQPHSLKLQKDDIKRVGPRADTTSNVSINDRQAAAYETRADFKLCHFRPDEIPC